MAKIVRTDIQETALKAVQGNLRALAGVNLLLDSGEDKYGFTFLAGKKKVIMVAGKAMGTSILEDVRRKLAAETALLARKHSIRLEEKERAVLERRSAREAVREPELESGEAYSGETYSGETERDGQVPALE